MKRHAGHIDALIRATDDGHTLLAPRLGVFTRQVDRGAIIEAGTTIGTIDVLHRSFAVVAPAGIAGRVSLPAARRPVRGPVAWGDVLLDLARLDVGDARGNADSVGEGLASGEAWFCAPMEGQFYRRPTPQDPPFLDVGTVVNPGDTIGLIEVMKFFYPIRFEGAAPVRVTRVATGDATPVDAGTHLFAWQPA